MRAEAVQYDKARRRCRAIRQYIDVTATASANVDDGDVSWRAQATPAVKRQAR